jgi:hypothetical protein
MRKIVSRFAFLAVFVALFPSVARAGTVTLNDWTTGNFANNAPDGGGAFQATTVGGPLGTSTFLTFCLEFSEHFSYSESSNYELSDAAKAGGGSAVGGEDPLMQPRSLILLANSPADSMNPPGIVIAMSHTGFDVPPRHHGSVRVSVPDSGSSLPLFVCAIVSLLVYSRIRRRSATRTVAF